MEWPAFKVRSDTFTVAQVIRIAAITNSPTLSSWNGYPHELLDWIVVDRRGSVTHTLTPEYVPQLNARTVKRIFNI